MIEILDFFGVQGIWTSVAEPGRENGLSLQVAPNPVAESTFIRFTLEEEGQVVANVYNLNGQLVDQVCNARMQKGSHEIRWDSKGIQSGMYLLKLQSGSYSTISKLLIAQ
jgi:flagellar hook assembly protein FlgD